METSAENGYADEARTRKALAMASLARNARGGRGYTADEVEAFSDHQWILLARAADREDASETTRRMVVSAVRAMDAEAARDPFDGL
jgi:hypothetical protein